MNSGIRGFSLELQPFWVAALLDTVLTLPRAPGSHTERIVSNLQGGWRQEWMHSTTPTQVPVVWVLGWSKENPCFRLADLTQRGADDERNTQSTDGATSERVTRGICKPQSPLALLLQCEGSQARVRHQGTQVCPLLLQGALACSPRRPAAVCPAPRLLSLRVTRCLRSQVSASPAP